MEREQLIAKITANLDHLANIADASTVLEALTEAFVNFVSDHNLSKELVLEELETALEMIQND